MTRQRKLRHHFECQEYKSFNHAHNNRKQYALSFSGGATRSLATIKSELFAQSTRAW
jgi:hypothetical protein